MLKFGKCSFAQHSTAVPLHIWQASHSNLSNIREDLIEPARMTALTAFTSAVASHMTFPLLSCRCQSRNANVVLYVRRCACAHHSRNYCNMLPCQTPRG